MNKEKALKNQGLEFREDINSGGVEIGDNAIVGAGAVVLKDVPAACVACGVPATVVKKLVEEK